MTNLPEPAANRKQVPDDDFSPEIGIHEARGGSESDPPHIGTSGANGCSASVQRPFTTAHPDKPETRDIGTGGRPKVLPFERYEKITHGLADRAGPKLLGYAYDIARWTIRNTGDCRFTTEELSEPGRWDCTTRNVRLILGKLEVRGVISWDRRRGRTRILAAEPTRNFRTEENNFPTEEINVPALRKKELSTYNQSQKTERESSGDDVAEVKRAEPLSPEVFSNDRPKKEKASMGPSSTATAMTKMVVDEFNERSEALSLPYHEEVTTELIERIAATGETLEQLRPVIAGLFFENIDHRNPDQRRWSLKNIRLASAFKAPHTRERLRGYGDPVIENERVDAEIEKQERREPQHEPGHVHRFEEKHRRCQCHTRYSALGEGFGADESLHDFDENGRCTVPVIIPTCACGDEGAPKRVAR